MAVLVIADHDNTLVRETTNKTITAALKLSSDVDVLVVNRVEASTLSAHDDPARAAEALQHAGAREVCVTLGAEGALWIWATKRPRRLRLWGFNGAAPRGARR